MKIVEYVTKRTRFLEEPRCKETTYTWGTVNSRLMTFKEKIEGKRVVDDHITDWIQFK